MAEAMLEAIFVYEARYGTGSSVISTVALIILVLSIGCSRGDPGGTLASFPTLGA